MLITTGSRQALTMAAGWLMSGVIVAGGYIYATEIKDATKALLGISTPIVDPRAASARPEQRTGQRTVEIKAAAHGHYFATVDMNGRRLDVLVDTGASMVALTYDDARRLGLSVRNSDFTMGVQTANGTARFAPVMLDRVNIGNISVRDVQAAVAEPGRLSTTLLGMSFLSRLQRVDMRPGLMVLTE